MLGAIALVFSQDKIKKILCLSFIYINFTILVIVISNSVNKQNQVSGILATFLILFSINLLVGFSIAKSTQEGKGNCLAEED